MNFLTRFGDKHDRKDRKMPDRSHSVDPTTSTPALSPTESNPRPVRRLDNPSASPTSPGSAEPDWVVADDMDNEAASHLHGGKRRTVSISRSGRYKSRSKGRARVLSEDVYSGNTSISITSPKSPSIPIPKQQQPPQPKKDLVKPSARDKSPARPYMILKSDTSVKYAIESTTL